MFIVWGTKHKQREAGRVVDNCPRCGEPTAWQVTRHYAVSHLCGGSYKGSTRTCASCGQEMGCEEGDYPQVVPADAAAELSFLELARRTNPRLVAAMERRARLESLGKRPDTPAGGRLADLAAKIEGCEETEDGQALMERLERWSELSEAQREELGREVEEAAEGGRAAQRAVSVILEVCDGFPGNAGCASGLLAGGILAAAAFGLFPVLRSWGWGIAVVVGCLIVAVVVFVKVNALRVRRWVRRKLIPAIEAAEADPLTVMGCLASIDTDDEDQHEGIRNLAGNLDELVAVLVEEGAIDRATLDRLAEEAAEETEGDEDAG